MEMTPRERFLATVAFEPVDRPYRQETIGYWTETVERWRREGLPPEIDNELAALLYFGIDKRALFTDRETIKAEVMRVVPPMLEHGGYMPSIDHAVPPDVSLEDWKYFVELGRDKGERCCR